MKKLTDEQVRQINKGVEVIVVFAYTGMFALQIRTLHGC